MRGFVEMYDRVINFNLKAGVKDEVPFSFEWWKAIELQSKLLVEESEECYDAARYGNSVELLDGCIDNLVIAFKLADMLHQAGYDVMGAFEAVCDNNDEKIFNSYYQAVEEKELLEERDDVEFYIETAYVEGVPYFTVRRLDGKIMKKVGFKAVELEQYCPKQPEM